jgi:hypothetical protein
MANSEQQGNRSAPVPGARRKAVPIAMATGPHEYTPGDQEYPVQLTSLAERARSKHARLHHLVIVSSFSLKPKFHRPGQVQPLLPAW